MENSFNNNFEKAEQDKFKRCASMVEETIARLEENDENCNKSNFSLNTLKYSIFFFRLHNS